MKAFLRPLGFAGFPKLGVPFWESPHNKDHGIFGVYGGG